MKNRARYQSMSRDGDNRNLAAAIDYETGKSENDIKVYYGEERRVHKNKYRSE